MPSRCDYLELALKVGFPDVLGRTERGRMLWPRSYLDQLFTRDVDQLDGRRDPGRLLDTFVLAQLRGELQLGFPQPRLYHLRDRNGDHEVDLIAELDAHRLIAIEVKATAAPRVDSARHLIWLRDQLGERFVAGVVLHTGPRVFSLAERIIAAPVAALWS